MELLKKILLVKLTKYDRGYIFTSQDIGAMAPLAVTFGVIWPFLLNYLAA